MNHASHVIGDSTSVANRLGSENAFARPEKLLDVLCYNNTSGTLFMQVFSINDGLIPFGTAYSAGGAYTLSGLTIGHNYAYTLGANETTLTNGAQVFTKPAAGTFKATATTAVFAGTNSALVTCYIKDVTTAQATPAPAAGSVPRFSFPVQSNLGGTLGRCVDTTGIFCAWSSTQATYTAVAASGAINIIIKG